MALRKEEIAKTPFEKVQEKLQEVLEVMNVYIRKHVDKVEGKGSEGKEKDRLQNIKTIATLIYAYYDDASWSSKFNTDLDGMVSRKAEAEAKDKNIIDDFSNLTLLPQITPGENATAFTLPKALHEFHNIINSIESEIAKMWSLAGFGKSELGSELQEVLKGSDKIAQEIGTNVYFIIFGNALILAEITKAPQLYPAYIHQALSPAKSLYNSSVKTASIFDNSYFFLFATSKKAAVETYTQEHREDASIGAQFSFCLQKDPSNKNDKGKYIPLLSTVRWLDIYKKYKNSETASEYSYPLKYRTKKDDFIIDPDRSRVLGK